MRKFLLSLAMLMAVAVSASADEPTYTAVGNTSTTYNYLYNGSTYPYSTADGFPSLSDLSVESYSDSDGESIIIRKWWGVENYDLSIELDASGNIETISQIVNGETKNSVKDGYSYVDTGVETSKGWTTAVYNSYSWYATDDNNAYIVLGLYLYTSEDYSAKSWGYYVISWPLSSTSINYITAAPSESTAKSYNLLGQPVSSDAKGLVIKNGKKVFVK